MYILPLGKMYFKAGAIDFLFLGGGTQKQKVINQIHFLASSQTQLNIITPSVEGNYLNAFFPIFTRHQISRVWIRTLDLEDHWLNVEPAALF